MKNGTYQFNQRFDESYQPVYIGRIQLCDGTIVRLVFTDEGFKIAFPKSALQGKGIVMVEDPPSDFSFPIPEAKDESQNGKESKSG